MKSRIALIALLVALVAGVLSPSLAQPAAASTVQSHNQSHAQLLDKTRFLAHMGVAFFAFHHFVWKRYQAGDFKKGAAHRTSYIVKAAIALLFTFHELHKAYDIANKSHSATLHALAAPINALIGKVNGVHSKLAGGKYSDSDVTGLNSQVGGLGSKAGSNGYSVKDIPVGVPGA